jgi:hypothetical protein
MHPARPDNMSRSKSLANRPCLPFQAVSLCSHSSNAPWTIAVFARALHRWEGNPRLPHKSYHRTTLLKTPNGQ